MSSAPVTPDASLAGSGIAAPREHRLSLESLVPSGGVFRGLVSYQGSARLDGDVEGRVEVRGSLLVGPAARIVGDVEVDVLHLEGSIEGEVRARVRIVLEASARVLGDLETPLLEMADGSLIDGRCRMTGARS